MALPQEHVKALDQLRVRLNQLIISLESMYGQLASQDPLPTWPALQTVSSAVGQHMAELSDALNSQHELFSTMHAYATSKFPAYDPQRQELLYALLYKKLELRGEEWIDKALQEAKEQKDASEDQSLPTDQMEELWDWASDSSRKFFQPWFEDEVFEDNFTVAERENGVENVVTGIKRNLDSDEDEDEDAMDSEKEKLPSMEDTLEPMPKGFDAQKPAIPLESLLRFATTGQLNPPGAIR